MNKNKGMGKKLQMTRKNWVELAVMTVIFVIAAILVYKTSIAIRVTLPRITTLVEADEGNVHEIQSGDTFEQSFLYPKKQLLSTGTQIMLNDSVVKDLAGNGKTDLGSLSLQVIDTTDGNVLMSENYQVFMLKDGQNLIASFPSAQGGFQGRELKLVLKAEKISPKVELKIGLKEHGIKGTELLYNGEKQDMTLNIQTSDHQFLYWKQWAVFGAVIVYLLLVGTYFALVVLRLRPEQVFLFSGSMLAVLYLLLIPPIAVPDEEAHFKEAYYYSNQIMGIRNTNENTVTMDLEDFHAMQVFETTPSLSEYDIIKERILETGREEGTKDIKRLDTQAPAVTYTPGILGIITGRILGLNGLMVIYLGRICSILFYLFMMYWFIRWMPFGKAAAFIIAILPMTLQQCGSYSYDSVVIEVAFVYLALLLGLLYDKDKPIQKWQIVIYGLCIIMLSICKGGSYLPLCLLTLLIPIERFSNKKKKWIFVGGMAAISIAAFLFSTLSYVLYVAAPTAEQAAGSYLQGEAYGMAGILQTPWTFINLCVRTLFLSGDGFLETMMGMQLGWLNINVTRIVIYGLLLLMILSLIQTEKQKMQMELHVTRIQKISYTVVSALSVGMVFASMFMSWTPKLSTTIAGIQGRYFLPLLPIFLLLFQSKEITIKKDITNKLMFLGVCLQCVAIYCILLSLERIL